MREISVVIGLGGNPSPLYALVWGLLREPDVRVKNLRVVVGPRNRAEHLEPELACSWAEFRASVGGRCPTRRRIELLDVGREEHEDDRDERFGERLWAAFTEATRAAAPAVLALGGTRHRAVASLATTIFAMHARPGDRLVDVRLLPKALEERLVFFRGGVLPGEVRVDDVPVPRLRGLADPRARTFADAVFLGQRAIDRASLPRLVLDLSASSPAIQLGDIRTPADNPAHLLWWAILAHERITHPDGEGWVPCGDAKRLKRFVALIEDPPWIKQSRSEVVQYARGVEPKPYETTLNQFRSRANKAFQEIVEAQFPRLADQLAVEVKPLGKGSRQRLPMEAAKIEIVGLPKRSRVT